MAGSSSITSVKLPFALLPLLQLFHQAVPTCANAFAITIASTLAEAMACPDPQFLCEMIKDRDRTIAEHAKRIEELEQIVRDLQVCTKKYVMVKHQGETVLSDLEAGDTVDTAKALIRTKWRIPPGRQKLTFKGVELKKGILAQYDVRGGDQLQLQVLECDPEDPVGEYE